MGWARIRPWVKTISNHKPQRERHNRQTNHSNYFSNLSACLSRTPSCFIGSGPFPPHSSSGLASTEQRPRILDPVQEFEEILYVFRVKGGDPDGWLLSLSWRGNASAHGRRLRLNVTGGASEETLVGMERILVISEAQSHEKRCWTRPSHSLLSTMSASVRGVRLPMR